MPRYLVAGHGENELLGIALTRNGDLYDGSLRALQHVRHFGGGQSIGGLVVDFDNHVTWADSRVVRRRASIRRHNHGVVVARRDDHAYAVVLATLVFTKEGELLGIEETRMGRSEERRVGKECRR